MFMISSPLVSLMALQPSIPPFGYYVQGSLQSLVTFYKDTARMDVLMAHQDAFPIRLRGYSALAHGILTNHKLPNYWVNVPQLVGHGWALYTSCLDVHLKGHAVGT